MDVRVVKERVLRTLVERRVGSNPTPCTSELSTDTSEVRSRPYSCRTDKEGEVKIAFRRFTYSAFVSAQPYTPFLGN